MNTLSIKNLWALAGLLLIATAVSAQTNPIAKFYDGSEGYPAWTDEINWTNRRDMSTYSNGANDFEKFENARDELYNQGGGVLYYPAGTYTFNCPSGPNGRGLMLKTGVVILGEEPTNSKRAIKDQSYDNFTEHGLDSLKTKFVFTDTTLSGGKVPKMWNQIGITTDVFESGLRDVARVGIAWIEMEKGYIWMGYDLKKGWANTWGSSKSWLGKKAVNGWSARKPDGKHPMDGFAGTKTMGKDSALMGGRRFVFGVKMTNCILPNYVIDKAQSNQLRFYHENSAWRFGPRVGVYGNNIFIANNVLDTPTASFVHKDAYHPDKDVLFDYGYSLGIDVNKSLWSFVNNVCDIDDPNAMYYQENIVIRDNWVYNHGHKGFEFTGKWAVIKNNVNARDFHGKSIPYSNLGGQNIDGYVNHSNADFHTSESVDDNMSRAYDFGGWNLWLDNNRWGATGSSFANDGEGMLVQRHNGVEVFSFAYTHNLKQPGVRGDPGYIAPYDVHVVGMLHFDNIQPGGTGVSKVQNNFVQDVTVVENYKDTSRTTQPGTGQTGPNVCSGDKLERCPPGNPKAPSMSLDFNKVEGYVDILYTDSSQVEIGFRIDRKAGNETEWTTIAYRPRQNCTTPFNYPGPKPNYPSNTGHCFNKSGDFNPSKWRDYTITVASNYQYRVIALNCAEDTANSVQDGVITGLSSQQLSPMDVKLFPNPASDQVQIALSQGTNEVVRLRVMDLNGRLVKFEEQPGSDQLQLDVSSLSAGQYLLRIDAGPKLSVTEKLTIR